jgi:hypothetical protein
MSLLKMDSFAMTPSDMTTYGKWWGTLGSTGPVAGSGTLSRVAGRSSGGYALRNNGAGGSSGLASLALQANLGSDVQRLTIGFGWQVVTAQWTGSAILWLGDTANASLPGSCLVLAMDTTLRQLVLYRGSTELCRMNTSYGLSRWHYVELALFVSSAAGWAELRLDNVLTGSYYGGGTSRANATGNTQPGSIAGMRWLNLGTYGAPAGAQWDLSYADFVACNGAGTRNNDFLGDLRVVQLPITAQGAHRDWAPGGTSPGGGVASPTNAPTLSTAATGGTVAAGAYLAGYTWTTANGETTLSPTASVTTTGTTSTLTITPPTRPGAATGWNLYLSQAGGTTLTKQNATPLTGANFVQTAPPTNSGAAPPALNGTGTNWQAVSVDPAPGDASFVQASTTGNIDTYQHGAVPSNVVSVLAVQSGVIARKADPGARTIAPLLRLASVDTPVGAGVPLQTSYAWVGTGPLETEPSGAAWSVADVNALELGEELMS